MHNLANELSLLSPSHDSADGCSRGNRGKGSEEHCAVVFDDGLGRAEHRENDLHALALVSWLCAADLHKARSLPMSTHTPADMPRSMHDQLACQEQAKHDSLKGSTPCESSQVQPSGGLHPNR